MKRILLSIVFLIATLGLDARNREYGYVETYVQYVPFAAALGLAFLGPESQHGFFDRGIEAAVGGLAVTAMVNLTKYTIREERPDGSAFNSFPSGHTATAFYGAELVRKEYGWGWGAGAYAVAASVGVMRVCHQRHWWWDACAGACMGVLGANIGGWLLQPVRNLLGLNDRDKIALVPSMDPLSGAWCASLSIQF